VNEKKEVYVQPVLVTHELLRDITAKASGRQNGNYTFGRLFGGSHRGQR
jgi:hypothetical protein